MPDEAVNEMTYSLVYRHSVDDKRRVPVPFRWRPGDPTDFALVVWPKHRAGTCLRVFPPVPWAKFRAEIEAMPDANTKPILKRMVGTNSTVIKLDAAGRLAIPEEMTAQAGITDQAVLVGLIDRFEIWNPARYDAAFGMDSAVWKQALDTMGE